jgi:GT2 family glycosyltransferase
MKSNNLIDVSICIIAWNCKQYLINCLDSIYRLTKNINYEVIIIDNGSTDGTRKLNFSKYDNCRYVFSKKNLGFSEGNNYASKLANGEYLLLLNPDTQLLTNAVKGMFEIIKSFQYGAIGCRLLNEDLTIQTTCARDFVTPFKHLCYFLLLYKIFKNSSMFSTSEISNWDHKDDRIVPCISGACIMIEKSFFSELDGFGSNVLMYEEDLDLCYRINKTGKKIFYLSSETIIHFGAKSSGQKYNFFSIIKPRQAEYAFLKSNFGNKRASEYMLVTAIGSLARIIIHFFIMVSNSIFKKNGTLTKEKNRIKSFVSLFAWSVNSGYKSLRSQI